MNLFSWMNLYTLYIFQILDVMFLKITSTNPISAELREKRLVSK